MNEKNASSSVLLIHSLRSQTNARIQIERRNRSTAPAVIKRTRMRLSREDEPLVLAVPWEFDFSVACSSPSDGRSAQVEANPDDA